MIEAFMQPAFRRRIMVLGLCFGGSLLMGTSVTGQAPTKKQKSEVKTPKPETAPVKAAGKIETGDLAPQVVEINKQIEAQWKANKIEPSKPATDFEFIRRASLDIIGRIATVDEIARYLKDPPATRRAQLIERLLTSDAYAENWANIWSVWLLTRSSPRDREGHQTYREQMQVWLRDAFAESRGWDKIVTELLTATGTSNENGAVNFVLSHLGEPTPPGEANREGRFSFVPITSRTTRLFLGLQTQCTQCHDHPFNAQWKQSHFWGVNAFFRQVERKSSGGMMQNNRMNELPKLELSDNRGLNKESSVTFETRKAIARATRPEFLDGKRYVPGPTSRRQQLALYVVDNEYFTKAYVNRLWGHFFGRGLTVNGKDVDDFGEHNPETHPLTEDAAKVLKAKHPERFKEKEPTLLDYLGEQFRASPTNCDPRALIRWICNSRAYNLASAANGSIEVVEDQEVETKGVKKKVQKKYFAANDRSEAEPFFSRMLLKSMTPEQLFDSLWVSTYANPHARTQKTRDDQRRLRNEWLRRLTVSFGDDEGNETTFNGTVVQALMLMNGKEINEAIEDKGGPVNAALRRGSEAGVVDELYLATLNRRPTKDEMAGIVAKQDLYDQVGRRKPRKGNFYEQMAQDLLWAVLNSSEFLLNH